MRFNPRHYEHLTIDKSKLVCILRRLIEASAETLVRGGGSARGTIGISICVLLTAEKAEICSVGFVVRELSQRLFLVFGSQNELLVQLDENLVCVW